MKIKKLPKTDSALPDVDKVRNRLSDVDRDKILRVSRALASASERTGSFGRGPQGAKRAAE